MRFMLVETLVLIVIITVVDAGGRHRVRNGIHRRYSYGYQASFWKRYHQRRTWTQMSCKKMRRLQACSRCCSVDGNWGPWSGCNPCSVTCGNGTQSITRSCDNPAPAYGGADCHGDGIDTRSCNMINCPVSGNWGIWSEFNPCSVSCGNGTQSRTRSCDDPTPAYGGADCPGNGIETRSCNTMIDCPMDGNWGTWSEFSTCCSVCGVVEQNGSRLCDNPVPEMGGADCPGDSEETRSCNSNDCLDNVTKPLCANQSFDVIVLVEVSANISDDEVGYERDLLQKLYTELRIDGDARRFGFIAHGGFGNVFGYGFNRLLLGSGTISAQKTRISNINRIGGMPLLKEAVTSLSNEFIYLGRSGIRRSSIWITADETTPTDEVQFQASVPNTVLYGIGIGDRVSEEYVQLIATNPTGAINTGPTQLEETATQIEQLMCFCDK